MDNSLLAVRVINHKYIVVGRRRNIMENNNVSKDEEISLELEEVRNDKEINWYFI